MRTADSGFDAARLRDLVTGPGVDTRTWVSMGLVDSGTAGDEPPVTFDEETGQPLVMVTLQPSGVPVICRVAGMFAGAGEASYRPFIEQDEVVVLLPSGDEADGPLIIGRCNNAIDAWPRMVAGLDTTTNTLAFDRTRVPYAFEAASSWMVRSAATGAFISMSQDGKIVISNADKALMTFNPDFIGIQSADGSMLMQLDLHDKLLVLQAGKARLQVAEEESTWLTLGTIALAGYGAEPKEHATTAEATVNIVNQVLIQLGVIIKATGAAPLTGTVLGNLLKAEALVAPINLALVEVPTASIADYADALQLALFTKTGQDNKPSAGSPSVKIG